MKPFAMACLSVPMVLVAGGVASAERVKNVEIEAESSSASYPGRSWIARPVAGPLRTTR